MEVTPALKQLIAQDARERGISMSSLVSRLIVFMAAARQQQALGRSHIGFVSDSTKLDAQFII